MGVDDGVVVPRLRVQTIEVQLTGGQHRVGALTVDFVSSHIEVGGETVVLTELLELAKRVGHQGRVNDANVRSGHRVGSQCSGRGLSFCLVGNFDDLTQPIRVARGLNVSFNKARFEGSRARVNLEALNQPRIGLADDQVGHDEQRGTHNGGAPPSNDCRDNKSDSHQRGNPGEDSPRRNGRVCFGETGSEGQEARARRNQRRILLKPQTKSLNQEVEASENRQLDTHDPRDTQFTPVHRNGSVEEASRRCGDGRNQHNGAEEAHNREIHR